MSRRGGRQNRRDVATSGGFTPASLPGLIARYRADQGVTIVSSHVSAWADISGNGNNLTQATAGNRPTVTASWSNGRPAITFASASQTGLGSAAFAGGNISVGTIFIVANITGANQVFQDGLSGDSVNRWFIDPNGSTNAIDFDAGAHVSGVSSKSLASPQCHVYVFAGAGSAVYVAGTLVTTGNAGANALSGLTIGNNQTLTGGLDGNIGEVAVYSQAFTGQTAALLEAYAQGFWGVP